MNILLTNDDGFDAKGIQTLYSTLSQRHNVTVVAPQTQQSGVGQSFTLYKPLKVEERKMSDHSIGYAVSGSPADCVKIGICSLMNNTPDCVIAGINDGRNSGIAAFYSGTVAGAREGAFWRIPGIAFSMHENGGEFLQDYSTEAMKIIESIVSNSTDPKTYYNINFPNCKVNDAKGTKITKQSMGFYKDWYDIVENNGEKEYWIRGEMVDVEESIDYDFFALNNDYITVTPLTFDSSATLDATQIEKIEKLDIKESL